MRHIREANVGGIAGEEHAIIFLLVLYLSIFLDFGSSLSDSSQLIFISMSLSLSLWPTLGVMSVCEACLAYWHCNTRAQH